MQIEHSHSHSYQSSITEERTIFRLWLQRQFTERCKRNPHYSLRAFANALELDASSLSQILSGKRNLSKKGIKKICEKLSVSPKELQMFGLIEKTSTPNADWFQVSMDTFSVISEWYHYAILELTYISGFKADPKWIAKKLFITTEEAKGAVERLKRLGLLLEENGSLIKSSKKLTNQAVVDTSNAHKELQRQVVSKALLAIDQYPKEEKDITSMTMAIDPKNLGKARLLMQKFRRDLCELLEEGNQQRVYHLGIQLYPVSRKEE